MNSLLRNKFRDSDLDTAKIKAIDRVKGRVSLSMRNGLTSVGTYLYDIATLREGMNVLVGNVNGSYVILNEIQNIPRLGTSYSVRRPVIPVPPPVHDPNALLILNFEGEDGATTWVEEVQGLIPNEDESYNFEIDTSQSKFGSSSLTTPYDDAAGVWYDLPEIYSGDFTLHGWVRWTGGSYDSSPQVYNSFYTMIRVYNQETWPVDDSQMNVEPYNYHGSVYLNVYIANDYGNPVYQNDQAPVPSSADGWHHFAMIGWGNNIAYAIDGTMYGPWSMDHPMLIKTFWLFAYANPTLNASLHYDAWEFLTYAKWTTFPFTPPTSPP